MDQLWDFEDSFEVINMFFNTSGIYKDVYLFGYAVLMVFILIKVSDNMTIYIL